MKWFVLWMTSVVMMVMIAPPVWAEVAGQVIYLSGTISAQKDEGALRLLTEKSSFDNGDTLHTSQDSYARLKFADHSEIALRPNSSLKISEIHFKQEDAAADSFVVNLIKGGLRSVTGLIGKRNKQKVKYDTVVATIGIRGTHFGLMLCQANDCASLRTLGGEPLSDGLHMDVADGTIDATNKAGQLVIETGDFAYAANAGTAPEKLKPDDGYRVMVPLSVMFDENASVWSEGATCRACVLQ